MKILHIISTVILAFVLFISCSSSVVYANDPEVYTTFFDQQWLKAVVSIEVALPRKAKSSAENQKPEFSYKSIGTGFVIASEHKHRILVTAKHVILDDNNKLKSNLVYRVNLRDGKSKIISDAYCTKRGAGEWFYAKKSDLAIRLILYLKKDDILNIPQDMILKKDSIQAGTPALILGFPMGQRSEEYAKPLVRNAIVALVDSEHFIIDGFAFPGNSGGPVVYKPSPIPGIGLSGSNKAYLNKQMLIGLVSSYIPYADVAVSLHTKRPRITFEENSGLTNVVPADEIIKLIQVKEFKKLDENVD